MPSPAPAVAAIRRLAIAGSVSSADLLLGVRHSERCRARGFAGTERVRVKERERDSKQVRSTPSLRKAAGSAWPDTNKIHKHLNEGISMLSPAHLPCSSDKYHSLELSLNTCGAVSQQVLVPGITSQIDITEV